MQLLRFLEGIRFPLGDRILGLITYCGDETVFIVVGLLVFWCISKRMGYYLLSVGLSGTAINQGMKLLFRIPRPWVTDPSFTIVESAREGASGYSFPSGHTQNAVGIYVGAALWAGKKWVKAVLIALAALVAFSRMYLGVHTPLDVGVAALMALALAFGLYPVFKKGDEKTVGIALFATACVAVICALFVSLYPFPADIDQANLLSGIQAAWTCVGATVGLTISYYVERRYIRFETRACWWAQALKLVLGFALLMGLRAGLKPVLNALTGGAVWANGIRYLLMVLFSGIVWPLTFPFFQKLGRKD